MMRIKFFQLPINDNDNINTTILHKQQPHNYFTVLFATIQTIELFFLENLVKHLGRFMLITLVIDTCYFSSDIHSLCYPSKSGILASYYISHTESKVHHFNLMLVLVVLNFQLSPELRNLGPSAISCHTNIHVPSVNK